jgi:hypothetical protein
MDTEEPSPIEEKQDEEYMKRRSEGKDPLEAANEAAPPETTGLRTNTNQSDSPIKHVEGPEAEDE